MTTINHKLDAKSFTSGRQGNSVKEIIIHHWGIDGQSHNGVVGFFVNTAATSAHFVTSAGAIHQLVSINDTAYHAGNWNVNLTSVGIECRPEMSAGDLETVAETIAFIWKQIGRKVPLRGHKQVKATACPGRYYSKLSWLYSRAEQLYSGKSTVAPVKPNNPSPAPLGSYIVKVTANELNIRASASVTSKITGVIKDKGSYTIVQTSGAWGRLKSGKGWIHLDYTVRVTGISRKSVSDIAREVIIGAWGNGQDRTNRLTKAGYNAAAVQAEVNRLL